MPDPVSIRKQAALTYSALALLVATTLVGTAVAQPAAGPQDADAPPAEEATTPADALPPGADPAATPPAAVPEAFETPYSAYDAGAYQQALQGFVDQQVENPENPEVALNLGSVHYQMKNFEEADRAFSQAALSADDTVRSQGLYNLGNSAFRQGRLEEAVELFKAVLDINPDDEDAKYNLEFVRDEIRRRHEEAKKRQEEQQQQQQDQQQQGDQQQDQQQQGDQQQDQQQQGDQQQDQQQQGGQDTDGDGLPDETERSAQNPTDPQNPDTDGDGLTDGEEDQNANGAVDEGETDPNKPDSDGDGTPDGQEAQQQQQSEPQGEGGEQPAEPEGLTEEEAERYLQGLEEGLPQQQRRLPPGSRRAKPEKDW
ncbi:MAG: tetratricopeptide repeat protein [Acidobacteriota bacterium]